MAYVYIIQEGDSCGRVKIGISSNVEKRLKSLQANSPRELRIVCKLRRNNPYTLERLLHREFGAYSVRGEWFNYGEKIQEFVNDPHAYLEKIKAAWAADDSATIVRALRNHKR